jgi:transcriptional regulator with XRE-family HTH domain
MHEINIHVGFKIREIRKKRNISLLRFSYLCDIEYSHLSKIEFGKVNTSIGHLLKIANALDVCVICLFVNEKIDVDDLASSKCIDPEVFSIVHSLKSQST